MPSQTIRLQLGVALLAVLAITAVFHSTQAFAQNDISGRKLKSKVDPVYPDIARRMAITGKVKLALVIAPNGTVKDVKAIGGHPILVNAAMEAVKKWKYEPGPNESSGVVECTFEAQP